MRPKLTHWIASLIVVLAATAAQATVSVEEIIRLHSAGLSQQSLLLVVSASDTPDTLSTAQLTQMIEAQVPDTVIAELVSKAVAVMEDWQPVDLEQEFDGRQVYTQAEVYNVYPSLGGYGGWPGYGWCGSPYYYSGWPSYSWYDWYSPWWGNSCTVPYSGFYVGVGWGGNWSVGFGFSGNYCGYYDPWYWGGSYYGYWADPYPGGSYYPGYGDGTYRVIDRPNYRHGAERGSQRQVSPTPYRKEPSAGTVSREQLATLDGRTNSSLDRSRKAPGRTELRDGTEKAPASRSVEKLGQVYAKNSDKTTLALADRGEGRYVIKGGDKKLREGGETSGRTMETLGKKLERSGSLDAGKPKSDHAVLGEVLRGLERKPAERGMSTPDRVAESARKVTHEALSTPDVETTGQKLNRYVQMKEAQRTSGTSRGSRTTATTTHLGRAAQILGRAEQSTSAPSGSHDEQPPAVARRAANKQETSGTSKAPHSDPVGRSAPRQIGGSGGAPRPAPSAGAPSRQGGGRSSGTRAGGGTSRGHGSRGGGRGGQ